MDALKENKALIGVAVVLALLVGVSAYTNRADTSESASSSDDTSQSQTATTDNKDSKANEEKDESTDDSTMTKDEEKKKSDAAAKMEKETTKKDSKKSTDTQKNTTSDTASSDKSYQYVAQSGDSYSVLARKAIQTYGIIHGVKMSDAEIVAAETKLTQDSGAMLLNQNQTINFDQSKVKSAINWAQDLSDADKAAWATYVPYVEFDTRQYGE